MTERDKRLLTTASGPLNPDAFLSFVRRAVQERWVETERMTRTDRLAVRGFRRPPSRATHTSDAGGAAGHAEPQTALLDPNANIALPRSGR